MVEPLIFEIYEDDDEYYANKVVVSVLASKVTKIEIDEIDREIVSDSIYQNFIKDISNMNLDKIEKSYLYEACECAMRNNILSATTMLGCAAEYLLINLSNAYYGYLKNNFEKAEYESYERKVINARSAYNRLDEFLKRVNSNVAVFQSIGFENPMLNFNFLDIIRKVRNQSGHPTGDKISQEELQMTIGNYQHFIKLAHKAIEEFPQI